MSDQPNPPDARAVLRLHGVGKEYRIYDSPRQRLWALLTGRALHKSKWALRDVSFELGRGQCLGVVGGNGAGKSTLLKLITNVLQPTCGQIARQGRITAILELGAGFHPDFTGRQNLYFGASLIGISQAEMARLEPQVLAFADIGEAIDRPVKTYSSGMTVRLAFALVTAVEPDLLIVDEALAVGDQGFQKKCIDRIEAFRRNGCTILFCSHSPYHVRHLCDVALWMHEGRMRRFGATEEVLLAYETHVAQQQAGAEEVEVAADADDAAPQASETAEAVPGDVGKALAAGEAGIVSVHVDDLHVDEAGENVLQSRHLRIRIAAQGRGGERPNMGVMLEQAAGVGITSITTQDDDFQPARQGDGTWQASLLFDNLPLHTGQYLISVYLFDQSGLAEYDRWYRFMAFKFIAPVRTPGLVRLPHRWE